MHETVAAQLAPAENLPCADIEFLNPLKGSAEFDMIRPRLAGDNHVDSWQEDGLHFFVFQLKPANGAMNGHSTDIDPPVAVFVMHADQEEPISAIVVTPLADGSDAEIRDLRTPDMVYEAPMSS
jgi:hypothetical protein